MKTKILGRTGLEVSIVGLGTIFIGSQNPTGQAGTLDEALGAQTVEAAVEAGCTLIDTAPLYGDTVSEKIIGSVLKQRPELAAKCTVVTKAGNQREGKNHSFDGILRSVEASQQRLGIEQFEIVYIHDALGVPVEQVMSKNGAFGALRKLQREGIIRHIGSATNDPEINVLYIETGEFDAAVVPNAWSLLNQRAAERILPAAEKHNVGICCGTPLERGLLAA
ncbi:MAG: aldo/keto reductase, partial [Candidatus Poribacteria bacterium]|nr:aldo/keto reductase [Candidatus Poribacteria bacterium]